MTFQGYKQDFFTISSEYVVLDKTLPYDIFINSSGLPNKEKFVRIYPKGEFLDHDTFMIMKKKYTYFYVLERHRERYLKSLVGSKNATDEVKVKVIKDSAIKYFKDLAKPEHNFSTEVLVETINNCKEVINLIVDLTQDYSVEKLYEMVAVLSFHDFYTYDHSVNVSMYTISFFRFINRKDNFDKNELINLGLAALLHDIGKLKISTKILNNVGKLSDKEFAIIKKHPRYGLDLLKRLKSKHKDVSIDDISRVVHEHHENFNGKGYPQGIEGYDIFYWARLVAIADFFDALTTKRSYHEVVSIEEALSIMEKASGYKIDPGLFRSFVEFIKGSTKIKGTNRKMGVKFDPSHPHKSLDDVLETDDENQDESLKTQKEDGRVIFSDNDELSPTAIEKRLRNKKHKKNKKKEDDSNSI